MYRRKAIIVCMLVIGSLSLHAQDSTGNNRSPVPLKTREDSVQYALGVYIGQWIINNGFTSLSPNLFLSGIDDIIRNRPLQIKDSMALSMIYAFQRDVFLEQAKKGEEQFFESLEGKEGINKLPGGVQYKIRRTGTGAMPQDMDSVIINFKGTLIDGTLFEDTYAKNISIASRPRDMLPGIRAALLNMPQGSIWELYIPSALAYGEKGNGSSIPPNNALVVIVELMAVKRSG